MALSPPNLLRGAVVVAAIATIVCTPTASCRVHAGDGHASNGHAPASTAPARGAEAPLAPEPEHRAGSLAPDAPSPPSAAGAVHAGETKGLAVNAGAGAVVADPPATVARTQVPPDASAAAVMLRDGNGRWTSGHAQNPNADASRRSETAAQGQHPFATILTCADSRIPVERVFDQGIGDLFVVRVAGNVVGPSEIGSIEYGVEHLHTPLLVIMGHTGCGAVKAAVEAEAAGPNGEDGDHHGDDPGTHGGAHAEAGELDHIGTLLARIEPAVERAQRQQPGIAGPALLEASIRENVWQSIFEIVRSSPACRAAIRAGHLEVVGAVYDLSTGEVAWLGEHPWQTEIVAAFPDSSSED